MDDHRLKTIHVNAQAGLANRIRVWASAEWMADQHGLEAVFTWDPDPEAMPALWEELFENELPRAGPGIAGRPTVRLEHPTFVDLEDPAIRQAEVLELYTWEAFTTDPEVTALSYRFWAEVRQYLLRLVPHPAAKSLVDNVVARFGPHTLGVQIRVGGGRMHFTTPNRTTTEMFFDEVDRQRAEIPGLKIYLATDTTDLVGAFRERYGSSLITMDDHVDPGFRSFESSRNIQIALAEILLLSRTQKLLGTYYSSFGVLAGALGALPFYEMGNPKATWWKFKEGPKAR